MPVTWNGNPAVEVAATTLAAATLPGMALQYNASAVLAPATTRIDAIMISEVVDATEWNNRMYLFKELDWSSHVRIGEPASVVKGVKGLTVSGLLMKGGTAIAVGDALLMGTAGDVGKFAKNGTPGTGDLAIALDACASTDTYSGRVHIL